MIPFDLGLKLKQPVPRFAPSAKREVKESEHVPYATLYDANTLLTRNEDLMQVIKIEGLPFETSSDNFLRLRKRFRNNPLRTMAKSQYALYVHTVRRKQHVYPDGSYPRGFAYDLNEAWKARHQRLELYVNDIYVSVVRKPRMAGVAGFKGFLDQLIGKRFERERELALRVAVKDLEELTARIMTSLSEYRPQLLGSIETPRGVFSELLRFVGLLVNCEDRPMRVPQMDLARYLPCNRLIFGRDAFEVRGINRSRVGAVLSIKEYESSTEYGLLDLPRRRVLRLEKPRASGWSLDQLVRRGPLCGALR
jgi:type IV secretion system protein VirB4